MAALRAPEIVAHRGTGKDCVPAVDLYSNRPAVPPENTLPALIWGWRRGTTCELDVRLTSDEQLVVIHDPTTGRTCDRDLTVADSSLQELRRLDAGGKKGALWRGLRLPTLREVLEVMPKGRRLYVELKTGPGINEPLVDVIREAGKGPEEITFISFNLEAIGLLKQSLPDFTCYLIVSFEQDQTDGIWRAEYLRTDPADARRSRTLGVITEAPRRGASEELCGALIDLVRRPVEGDEVLGLDGLDVSWRQPGCFAAEMAAAGVEWGCWTVDTADAAVLMRSKGAVQITTNCADDLRDALAYSGEAAGRHDLGHR